MLSRLSLHRLRFRLLNLFDSFDLFHSFQVTIGVFGHEEKVIYEPLTPAAIQVIFRKLNEGLFNPINTSLTYLILFVPCVT